MRLYLQFVGIFRTCQGIPLLHCASLFVLMLVLAVIVAAQTSQKVIKDTAEYNAYMAALNLPDPAAKGAAMEAFAQQYPRSVVYADALEQAMGAWQQAGKQDKVRELARRIVAADAGNVRAVAVAVALDRASATAGDGTSLDELCRYSTAGMHELAAWQRPEGMSDADFAALHKQMDQIFNGAAGFCALQQANYSQARDFLARAVADDPADLQNMYQLAVAELQMKPLDADGFWYCARGIHLADAGKNTAAVDSMTAYCKANYRGYHGSEEGWADLVSAAETQNSLPEEFAQRIKPVPTASSQ